MADKGKRQQYAPSALMQRYMSMDHEQARRAQQTSQWLEGLQQERRFKQADASGLGTLADIADIMTGGGKQYVMRPGLHKLPRLSASELMRAHDAHKAAGYAGKGAVRPTDWKQLFYYSAPPVGLGLLDEYQNQGQAESMRE